MASMRVRIRGFRNQVLRFAETVEIPDDEIDDLMQATGERHAKELGADELHMIEFEFLDELNPNTRFFRFGTDPSGMVLPVKIDLH
jgi:hypothetical protein